MNIRDYQIGDMALFKDGAEAKIVNLNFIGTTQIRLFFNKEVPGWTSSNRKSNQWVYYIDGRFETASSYGNDILKIVRS